MYRFADCHILVTGAGSGIGKAIALRLATEGAQVSLLGRRMEKLDETKQEISDLGGNSSAYSCDIREQEQLENTLAILTEEHGPLFAVIANSGIGGPNSPGENDRFEELIQTNLIGTYFTLRAAQKYLLEEVPTHLIVISSCLARFGVPGYTGYCASKAGLLGMVRAFALEVASQGTQINAICPGWVDTEMATAGLEDMAAGLNISFEEAKEQAMKAVPLGYMGKPKDVAGMVAWLISEDARGMTGQTLDINGGSWM